jgi:hypothetical protein
METIRIAVCKDRFSIDWEDIMALIEHWNYECSSGQEIQKDLIADDYCIVSGSFNNLPRIGRRIFVSQINYKCFDLVSI